MMVAADDHRGAVELTAGKVVGLEAAHVIQPALDAPRMVDAQALVHPLQSRFAL
jgi:hypothetical protein